VLARLTFSCLLVVGLLTVAGCGPAKLDVTKTYTLEPGDGRAIDLDAQSKAQTLNVDFSSTAGEINVLVMKKDDAPSDDDLLTADAAKALASKLKAKEGTVTAEVPANTAVRVIIRDAAKTSEVKVHVTNQN
jgi:hypothetical protein